MKLLPLIGTIFLSMTPVQAFETIDEVLKDCMVTEQTLELCKAFATISSAGLAVTTFCELEKAGVVAAVKLTQFWERHYMIKEDAVLYAISKTLWKEGVNLALEDYPNCPIKPIP